MTKKNETKEPLLLNELAVMSLFHLRALAKSPLGHIICYLRTTEGEFSDWLGANSETLMKDVPEFKDYVERLSKIN